MIGIQPKFGKAIIKSVLPERSGAPEPGRSESELLYPARTLGDYYHIVDALPSSVTLTYIAKGGEYDSLETGETVVANQDMMRTTLQIQGDEPYDAIYLLDGNYENGRLIPRFLNQAWQEQLGEAIKLVFQKIGEGKLIKGINC